jgi:hypothetical protein
VLRFFKFLRGMFRKQTSDLSWPVSDSHMVAYCDGRVCSSVCLSHGWTLAKRLRQAGLVLTFCLKVSCINVTIMDHVIDPIPYNN